MGGKGGHLGGTRKKGSEKKKKKEKIVKLIVPLIYIDAKGGERLRGDPDQ